MNNSFLFKVATTLMATTALLWMSPGGAFTPQVVHQKTAGAGSTTTALFQQGNQFMNWARQARSAQDGDTLVELNRPLGLVLNEDEQGNVYVETVAPKGNAARTGKIKEGDLVTMCSATFGDDMWSTRGVGLNRVLAAIRVRAGPTVSLVVESPTKFKKKRELTTAQIKAREKAEEVAQKKKDQLLAELEDTEQKLKKGKFLGLF